MLENYKVPKYVDFGNLMLLRSLKGKIGIVSFHLQNLDSSSRKKIQNQGRVLRVGRVFKWEITKKNLGVGHHPIV